MPIVIPVAADDAERFVSDVERIATGVARYYAPRQLILIKVDHWFGPRWLKFSGKIFFGLFGVGIRQNRLTIPPFVPERIVWQRRLAGEPWKEIEPGQPLHRNQPSSRALRRWFSEIAPEAAVLWFSGDSALAGRGSLMVYLPDEELNQPWYASWSLEKGWSVAETSTISQRELGLLMQETSSENVI